MTRQEMAGWFVVYVCVGSYVFLILFLGIVFGVGAIWILAGITVIAWATVWRKIEEEKSGDRSEEIEAELRDILGGK